MSEPARASAVCNQGSPLNEVCVVGREEGDDLGDVFGPPDVGAIELLEAALDVRVIPEHPELGGLFRSQSRISWLERLRASDIPAGPVQSVDEVFTDPQVLTRGMLQEVAHPAAGLLRLVANPLLRRDTPDAPPPLLGEGGEELARQWLAASAS
jgi:crotonobetainyl-CoA:carnitine CoA-transferase CaiB-like acyl-CoA transferase